MLKQLIFSVVWGIIAGVITLCALADYGDSYWAARVSRGGDSSPMDIGFTLFMIAIGIGVFVFVLGILELLPGTKLNKR